MREAWEGMSNSVRITVIIVVAILLLAAAGLWSSQQKHTYSCTRGLYSNSVSCTDSP